MAKQVQFYSVNATEYASLTSKDMGGIYFVDGGELYKGAKRFGANKVTAQETPPTAAQGAIAGDVNIYNNVAKIFTGSEWKTIVDVGSLGLDSKASVGDVSTTPQHGVSTAVTLYSNSAPSIAMTVGAVTSAAGITSTSDFFTTGSAIYDYANGLVAGASATDYVAAITRDSTTGKLTAQTKTFPTLATGDAAGQVKLGSVNATVNGWSDLSTDVTNLKAVVSYSGTGDKVVTATTGNFTNLNVSDTATFSATTVSATTLTVGGSTVNQIAQAEISAVTANTITATGTSLPTESAVATYVTAAVSNLAGAMHFKGTATITKSGKTITVSNFSETFTPAAGDVVVDTANNLEAVYTGSAWELLGSNSVYALDAYAPGTEVVTAGTTTLGGAVHAIAGAVDTLTTKVSTLENAVTGGDNDDGTAGVNVSVTTASKTAAPTVTVTVTKATLNTTLGTTNVADKTIATSIGATGVDTALATEKAVRDAISDAALVWKNANGQVIA